MTHEASFSRKEQIVRRQVQGYFLPASDQFALAIRSSDDLSAIDIRPPSTTPLVEFLRSDEPISDAMRQWIADILDVSINSDVNVVIKTSQGRTSLSHSKLTVRARHAAAAAEESISWNEKRKKERLHQVSSQFAVSEPTLKKYMQKRGFFKRRIKVVHSKVPFTGWRRQKLLNPGV